MQNHIFELEKLKQNSQFRTIKNIKEKFSKYIVVDDKKMLNLSSNDYLNLSCDKDLTLEFVDKYKKQIARYNKEHYIDMISPIIDEEGKVPVFTPNHKMISADCMHLTKFGAQFYASVLGNDIQSFASGVTVNTPLRKESE